MRIISWKSKKHIMSIQSHDLEDFNRMDRVNESLVSCHFRYFLLSHFYCHQLILQPEEVPKLSKSTHCPDRDRSTMISEEHNLQNSRLLSNFTAPGPSGPNLIWSKIIWEIGPTVMSDCFMIPIWSHVWGDSYRPSHWQHRHDETASYWQTSLQNPLLWRFIAQWTDISIIMRKQC